jgi:hypothetical protein
MTYYVNLAKQIDYENKEGIFDIYMPPPPLCDRGIKFYT